MEKSKKKKNKNFVLYYGVHIEIETERKLLSTAQTALNELLIAEKQWLPQFAEAIEALEKGEEPKN